MSNEINVGKLLAEFEINAEGVQEVLHDVEDYLTGAGIRQSAGQIFRFWRFELRQIFAIVICRKCQRKNPKKSLKRH